MHSLSTAGPILEIYERHGFTFLRDGMSDRSSRVRACCPLVARVIDARPPGKKRYLALGHGISWLVTRDRALLKLARRARSLGVAVVRPQDVTPGGTAALADQGDRA